MPKLLELIKGGGGQEQRFIVKEYTSEMRSCSIMDRQIGPD